MKQLPPIKKKQTNKQKTLLRPIIFREIDRSGEKHLNMQKKKKKKNDSCKLYVDADVVIFCLKYDPKEC